MKNTTIHLDELMKHTDLSETSLRAIAEKGFFPLPVKREYLLLETFAGLIRYYRSIVERKGTLDAELSKKRGAVADEEAGLKRVKRLNLEGKLVERAAVEKVFTARNLAIRDCVLRSPLPEKIKTEILEELENTSLEKYLK